MRKKLNIIVFFVCFLSLSLYGIDGLKFENITSKNGLSHNTVRSIIQDKQGFIWIGTLNGLNRYDGHEFVTMQPQFNSFYFADNRIKKTIEDDKGYIWVFSTLETVACYDPSAESFIDYLGNDQIGAYEEIEVMKNGDVWLWGLKEGACRIQYVDNKLVATCYDKRSAIQSNQVNFVFEDSMHQIWIGTEKKLFRIKENTVEEFILDQKDQSYLKAYEVDGNLYFITQKNTIYIVDVNRKNAIEKIDILSSDTYFNINQTVLLKNRNLLILGDQGCYLFRMASQSVTTAKELFNDIEIKNGDVFIDNKGMPWIFNKSGNIWQYDEKKEKFICLELIPPAIMSTIDLERYAVYHDSRDKIWITTYGYGLFVLDEVEGNVHLTRDNSGLKTNYLLSVFEDKSGEIWVGTEFTGITKISLTKYKKDIFFPDSDKEDVENKIIRMIFQDQSGDVWVGTKRGYVYVYDRQMKLKQKFLLPNAMPYCITEDRKGNKWIGTKGNGLFYFATDKGKYKEFQQVPLDADNLLSKNIYSLLIDSKERLWVGTFASGLLFSKQSTIDNVFFQKAPFNSQKDIRYLIEDNQGFIWAAGNNGIDHFKPDEMFSNPTAVQKMFFDQKNPKSLNNNEVKCVFEDSRGDIWVGTSGGGLNLAVRQDSINIISFLHYSSEKGLANNVIQAIEEDNDQNLWVSTENGISKFNYDKKRFENYIFSDTWESDLFCESSSFKHDSGRLMFGSYNGMYILDPFTFISMSSESPVLLTKLLINGNPVLPNSKDSPLKKSIVKTQCIELKNKQNSFALQFSALNYHDAYSSRYTYMLENYDKDWSLPSQYNEAIYKNVPPGKYYFKVKESNTSKGVDGEETALEIIVIPPFWKSNTAIVLYFVLFLLMVFLAIKLVVKMNNMHNAVVIERGLTAYRLRFFTNISHEFRTPLTIIIGSIENLKNLGSIPAPVKKQVQVLEKSASRLIRLIDQLLEFRKIQNNKMELRLEKVEAVSFFSGIYELFVELGVQKNIDFSFSSNIESKFVVIDKEKMDKIVFNLLSNAFKHTPEQGHISIQLLFDDQGDEWQLIVSDSGEGVPTEKRKMLFERFAQIDHTIPGIGIGLNLVYEFVRLHEGNVNYQDSEWGGASFVVTIPLIKKESDPMPLITSKPILNPFVESSSKEDSVMLSKDLKEYKLLIIEDDEEVRTFLVDQLSDFFTVSTAMNGKEGIEVAVDEQPNLIVCDVMMPEMNGFEVTKKLKGSFDTSHIPIILLTAHSSMEHQIEGIEAGADSYITKPFSTKYLITRVLKLIEQREKLQQKFSQEPGIGITAITSTNKDKEFLNKVHSVIEENLDNSEFAIDDFAQSMQLGRTMLYKKVKGITGYSPNEYIRIIRLKQAAEMLRKTDLNVSEIAYSVGFNDPFYFSRCFKKQFSVAPVDYRAGNESE